MVLLKSLIIQFPPFNPYDRLFEKVVGKYKLLTQSKLKINKDEEERVQWFYNILQLSLIKRKLKSCMSMIQVDSFLLEVQLFILKINLSGKIIYASNTVLTKIENDLICIFLKFDNKITYIYDSL